MKQIKWYLMPIYDFCQYIYSFLTKFIMICFFINAFEEVAYLWWDMYHWTRDHWYMSTFLVLMLSYITFKNARTK